LTLGASKQLLPICDEPLKATGYGQYLIRQTELARNGAR